MKKSLLVFVTVLMVFTMLSGCGKTADGSPSAQPSAAEAEITGEMPTLVNTAEYVLYQNIFMNDQMSDYSGQSTEKRGTFTILQDAYNDVTRYYVWGYNDQTKCCDWQWELKIDDVSDLPSNGSLVKVTGVYEENEDALDKFWIVDPTITVEKAFSPRTYDIDMQAMDDTLERVQTINIVQKNDAFEGKTVCGYGRIKNENTLTDPYYDGSWEIHITGDFELPAFGTMVLVSGVVRNGAIAECQIAENTQY